MALEVFCFVFIVRLCSCCCILVVGGYVCACGHVHMSGCYVCVCMWARTHEWRCSWRAEASDPRELERQMAVSLLTRVLGTELCFWMSSKDWNHMASPHTHIRKESLSPWTLQTMTLPTLGPQFVPQEQKPLVMPKCPVLPPGSSWPLLLSPVTLSRKAAHLRTSQGSSLEF